MKLSLAGVLVAATVLSVALALPQTKTDCPAKASSAKDQSCCVNAAKVEKTSNVVKDQKDPRTAAACPAGAKQCTMHAANMPKDCPAADRAKCDMTKASAKDCCKNGMKTSEAKNTLKKSSKSKAKVSGTAAETKGTD